MLDGSIGGRNATWPVADNLKTTVTKSRAIKHTLLRVSSHKSRFQGGDVSVVFQKMLGNISQKIPTSTKREQCSQYAARKDILVIFLKSKMVYKAQAKIF